ncbi:MAG TPA: APC family permease [Candidatus Dormibacteraeota bacterium]|nr:APC family permease [Candidatus Dormibacteraeota bacterium]
MSTNATPKAGTLAADSLGMPQVIFQSISNMAPGLSVVAGLTGVAAFAGGAMPLALVLGVVLAALLVIPVIQYARRVASAGGYYTYVSRGLNPRAGLYTGWIYLLYEAASLAGTVLFFGYLLPGLLSIDFGLHVTNWMWWPAAMISAGFIWFMSYRGIRISLNYSYVMGTLEILIFLVVAVWLLLLHSHQSTGAVFTTQLSPTGLGGVALGVIFSFLSLTGFGAAVTLGEEARNPLRTITRSVIVAIVGIGAFYIFLGYVSVVAWGPHHMTSYAASTVPFVTLVQHNLSSVWVWFLTILTLNGSLACALAIHNAQVRMLFSLGRDGLIVPRPLGTTHPKYQTPFRAIHLSAAVTIVGVSITGALLGPLEGFFLFGTIATLGALAVHFAVNISVPAYFRKIHSFNFGYHFVLPILGALLILLPIYFSVVPLPAFPVLVAPFVALVWLVAGVFVVRAVGRRRPELLARAGMLAAADRDADG